MDIIVFSDSHGDTRTLDNIIKKHKDSAKAFLFLGDGLSGIDFLIRKYPNTLILAVKGNNDMGYDYPYERVVVFDNTTIYMTHGHRLMHYDIKQSLKRKAKEFKASVVLYGHMHIPSVSKSMGVYYICPGSVAYPRGGSKKSYIKLSILNKNITHTILEVDDEL